MSAHRVFMAPIGSIVSWSDSTPRPSERHHRKLSAWKSNNSSGRLISRQDERTIGGIILPVSFTVHEAEFGGGGVIAIRVHRTFSLESRLTFTIVARPALGSFRVFDRPGDNAELVHLAADRQSAEEWLSRHGYPRAVLEEVTEDEVGADIIEGRAA